MNRLSRSAVLAILIAVAPACQLHAMCAPGPHPWSQREIARAALSEGAALDPAARLTEAGRYREALGALGRSDDSLRTGILASKAERFDEAIGLLRCRVDNPYLEGLRLYHYAAALRAKKRFGESASTLDTLCAMDRAGAFGPRALLMRSARELLAEVVVSSDTLLKSRGIPTGAQDLSTRSFIAVSEALMERGRDTTVVAFWKVRTRRSGSRERFDLVETSLFAEFLGRLQPSYPRLPSRCLLAFAQEAVRRGLDRKAEVLIGALLRTKAGNEDALLCRGMLFESRNRPVKALALYERLSRSAASVQIRKDALVRAASVQYKLKNYERAVERYGARRKLDASDTSWMGYTELAARIEISRGRYEAALALLKLVRMEARDVDGRAVMQPEAALCEAALRCARGDITGAHALLKPAEGDSVPWYAAEEYLYWLSRTSPTDSERVFWKERLVSEYPRSIYTAEANGGIDTFTSRSGPETSRDRIGEVLASEHRLLDSLCAGGSQDDSLLHGDAFEAYVYLLDRGLLPEAYGSLSQLLPFYPPSTVPPRSFLVYRAARERGLYWFSLRLLDVLGCMDAAVSTRLSHPVAYAAVLADAGATAGLPPEWILGIMREESTFNLRAASPDGALGLMQLLPSTARWMARRSPEVGVGREDLFDPAYNIRIGSMYFVYLLERFNGSLVGALAAYNGGEGKMSAWSKAFDPSRDPMLAIEMIGPTETRNYVKKVLASICVYRSLLEKERETR